MPVRTFCSMLLAAAAWAQSTPADAREAKLVALERMWNEAQVTGDSSALAAMVADPFTNTEYDGQVSDRQKFLAGIRDPQFKASFMNIQDVKVSFFQNTAIVTGIYHTKGQYSGKPYEHFGRFTDTWINQSGTWMCVASHSSLIKK
ncbi:MAG TPA: nuclear transport factor 2 family protein [Terriglobales bacterium]|nr:nuclear transport factor 2 family protein [Terriglobales bacterium]